MGSELRVLYIGRDDNYWTTLQKRFKSQFGAVVYDFQNIYGTDDTDIQSIIIDINNFKPSIIYLDFSKNAEEYLHLARLIKRMNGAMNIPTIGLFSQLTANNFLPFSLAAGIHLNHIKSAEIHDVVYDAIALASPGNLGEAAFATGQTSDSMIAKEVIKIGYLNQKFIHIEGPKQLIKDRKYQLDNYFTDNKIVKSKYFTAANTGSENLYYNQKYWCQLDFDFVDPIIKRDGDTDALLKERNAERQQDVDVYKKKLSKWLDENIEKSSPKTLKLLVIDKYFTIYNNEQRTDNYQYVIRGQPYLININEELKQLRPHLIAFQFDKKSGPADPDALVDDLKKSVTLDSEHNNDEKALQGIISYLVANPDYKPYIMIFNAPVSDSLQLQQQFDYKNMVAQTTSLDCKVLIKVADMLEKKINKSADVPASNKNFYYRKNNVQSFAYLNHPIKIVSISECEVCFTSDTAFNVGNSLILNGALNLNLTIVEHNETSAAAVGKSGFRALVNYTGEDDKKKLRQYINSIFFRDLETQKTAEKEEFKKVQENAKKKIEEEKKKAEEALKKQKEKEAKEAALEKKQKEIEKMTAPEPAPEASKTPETPKADKPPKKD
ncbi:MAG: hypothetical protein JNM93_06410 [Bacteriovoracaceae bacterium]|nr:hypothetical protein [Bacteriovoracaceae bacterium]